MDSNSAQIKTISKDITDIRSDLKDSAARLHGNIKHELEGSAALNQKIVSSINSLNKDLTDVKKDMQEVRDQIALEKQQITVLKHQMDYALKREAERLAMMRDVDSTDADDEVKAVVGWTNPVSQLINPFNALFVPTEYIAPAPSASKEFKSKIVETNSHPWTDFEKDISGLPEEKSGWSKPVPRQVDPIPAPPVNRTPPAAPAPSTSSLPGKLTLRVTFLPQDGLGMMLARAEDGVVDGQQVVRLRVKDLRKSPSGLPSPSELAGVKAGDIIEEVNGQSFETQGEFLDFLKNVHSPVTLVVERK